MARRQLEAREYTVEEIMAFEDPEWLIEGFVERGSCIFVSAQPKVGKSFFGLRAAAAVSAGADLFGHKTIQGNALYLAAERSELMKRRLQAIISRRIPFEADHFKMWPEPVMFGHDAEVVDFVKSLKVRPDLLVVDTLRRCNDGDERDNGHMGQWTKGIELFRDLTGSSVLVIHHDHRPSYSVHGRRLESSFSGAGAILGNLDGYFSLRPQSNGTIVIRSEGSNELNEFHVTVRIEHVDLGPDRRGVSFGTGVMVQVNDDGAIEEKPDLWPLLREVLAENPDVNMTRWAELGQQHPIIKQWWPTLNKSSISVMVRDHLNEVEITEVGNEKRCRLAQARELSLVVA